MDSENKSVLKFCLTVGDVIEGCSDESALSLLNVTNETEWMGKEPKSCRLIDMKQDKSTPIGSPVRFVILVGYRPHGWISDIRNDGRDRNNGWMLEIRDQTNDGTLLDGHGKPLTEGAEPVFLLYEHLHTAEFNDYDFGKFLGELEHDAS